MLKDILQITELYLDANGKLPTGKSWSDYHDNIVQTAPKDAVGLLTDANPKDKCKYALFVNVDTKNKAVEVKDYVEINALTDWSSNLFWQGSGGAQSDKIRNTPHKIYSNKKISVDNFVSPLKTILDDYCQIKEREGENKINKKTGPLFWDKNKMDETEWLENIVNILEKSNNIEEQIKENLPYLKSGESVFVGLTIDDRPLGEYELFRRYLLFVRIRAGIQKGADRFKHRESLEVMKELIGICPSCNKEKLLLDQWQSTAELSFYQTTNENHLSYAFPSSAFKLCQSCADLLFIFKQHLLEDLTRKLGGNECLILPSIKLIPSDSNEKRRLYENLKSLWNVSDSDVSSVERRLLYRLGQLPSYSTVTFIFGDHITVGKSQNVRRLDELNIIFPDVLPSRLSQIANTIRETNTYLDEMWALTGRNWNCTWNIRDDFQLLQNLFNPKWDEKKKDKSRRRPEVERYLRGIFYGFEITFSEIANDCYANLLLAFKKSRTGKNYNEKYSLINYIDDILSLMVFIYKLKNFSGLKQEAEDMTENKKFEFTSMPELGKFIEMHPLFNETQYLAPFFVGCLFSYAESLQKDNSRLAVYNWLGTMALSYEDILQDIYPKVLNYITKKEKIVNSPRLQEIMKAISYYDKGKCDNDRVALVSFCHGWAVGRDFIYKKKEETKNTNDKQNEGGNENE